MIIYLLTCIRNLFVSLGLDIRRASTTSFKKEIILSNMPDGDPSIAIKISVFVEKFGLFYENIAVKKELQISGAWGDDLAKRRPVQNKIYSHAKAKEIAKFHENMFFNELVSGILNYGDIYTKPKISKIAINGLFCDFFDYKNIYPNDSFIQTKPAVPYWGFLSNGEVITPNDVWYSVQAQSISDLHYLVSKFESKKSLSFIEIGSGFGGLAAKLNKAKIFDRLILIDIPHNLVVAYYYLSRSFGESAVELILSAEHLMQCLQNPLSKFILVPTSLMEIISSLKGDYIFGNFGSFSEMNYETIEFYLNNLPADTLGVVQINSNKRVLNSSNHYEVICDDFPFRDDLIKIYSGKPSGINSSSGGRLKITLHLKDKFFGNKY